MNFINQELYDKILENIPIICVDGVITNNENKILFTRRENEPAKGEWWFPGGRLLKNESLKDAIIRKVKEETNLDVFIVSYLGFTETIFNTGPFDIPVHTINFTYHLSLNSYDLKIDSLHSDFIWSDKIDELNLNTEILNLLKQYNWKIQKKKN
jgi:colanic acid biosynthesis protein WcaH